MNDTLYVFDLDETLINGDCAMIWNQFLVKKGVITDSNFLVEDRRLMDLYAQGKLNMEQYLEFTMTPLLDIAENKIEQLIAECVESDILPKLFPQAKTLIEQLQQQKADTLIISASVSFIVEKVAQRLGIDHALGIDLQCKHGNYTQYISGIATYREGKVKRLQQWLCQQRRKDTKIVFYTDSINDLPMCLHADDVVLINPCPQLRSEANSHPLWSILTWG